MIYVFLCAPFSFAESLKKLAEDLIREPLPLIMISHEVEEEDREIYQRLEDLIRPLSETDGVVILCDLLGSKSSTLVLSVTHPFVTFIGGVNLPMLLSLNQVLNTIHQREGLDIEEQLKQFTKLLKEEACAGICSSQEFIRESGEDSAIDHSILELDNSSL